MKAKILMRKEPCRCGCNGQDSWHAKTMQRTIYDLKPVSNVSRPSADGEFVWTVRREGTAQFPWGKEQVQELALVDKATNKSTVLGWQKAGLFNQ